MGIIISIRVAALLGIEPGEVVEANGNFGVIRAQGFFPDRQRAFIEWLGFGVAALVAMEPGKVIEASGNRGVIRAQGFFSDRQRAL